MVLCGESVTKEELVIKTDSKEIKRVLVSAKPIGDDAGNVAGFINFRSITEFGHVKSKL